MREARCECASTTKFDTHLECGALAPLWVEAVNNHGRFGRWEFIEISDPWDAAATIRATLEKGL